MTLLALRILILLLLVLTFARPRLRSLNFLPSGPRTLILVIDGSASMRCRDMERSNFENAKLWALEVLKGLHYNDKVAVILPGGTPSRVIFPTVSNHSMIRTALNDLRCGYRHVSAPDELNEILQTTKETYPGEPVELHFFSDFQATAWAQTADVPLQNSSSDEDLRLSLIESPHRWAIVGCVKPSGAGRK
ncbi:hypothetical protein BVY04_04190 [bacterium M21]|nr:hypothetical protein BVY04_04190 [bacterium M21]